MLTLASDIYFPFQITWKDPTLRDAIGGGAFASRRRWAKPLAHFKLNLPVDSVAEAQRLFAFYSLARGDRSFWFDGGTHGKIVDPQVFWIGDGATTQFMLPYRNIFAPTWVVYENGVVNPNWSAVESSGLFTFSPAPTIGAEISAKGERQFKVMFWTGEEDAFSQTEFFDQLFDDGIELREVP